MKDSFRALLVENLDNKFVSSIKNLDKKLLPDNEVLVKVSFSSLNFKDALSASGNKGVTRVFPHIPGIDAVGTVKEDTSKTFIEGQKVIITGYDLGMNTWGGFSEYIKVPAAWCVPLPSGLTEEKAMAIGTAGLTAQLCIEKIQSIIGDVKGKKILVSGATGGVGIWAVTILKNLQANVIALTGKESETELLLSLGADEVILRSTFTDAKLRPMDKTVYDAAIDVAGGEILTRILSQIKAEGAVACCGLVASPEITQSVFPFIIRGVSLLGVDSVEIPLERKIQSWNSLAKNTSQINEKGFTEVIDLESTPAQIEAILLGKQVGRKIVKNN